MAAVSKVAKNIFLWIIRVPASLWGPSCRFIPTCSEYTFTAIARFGVLRGTLLSCQRIAKCHPWYHGDIIDFVPDSNKQTDKPGKK